MANAAIDLAPQDSNHSFMNQRLIWIGRILLGLVVIGIVLPGQVVVEREVTIDAHKATLFALVNDFNRIELWSPTTEDDPNARVTRSGPPAGVGALLTWDGQIIGRGSQTITESEPYERVSSRIVLNDDVEATGTFMLSDEDGMTKVTWSYERDFGFNLAGRYFGLLLDGIHGPKLEAGLARLSSLAERLPRADFSDLEVERIVVEALDIAYLRTTSPPDASAMSEAMRESFFDILSFIDRHKLKEAGAPMSVTLTFSGAELVFDAAIPVRGITATTPRNETVKIGATYEGPVIRVRHIGSYASLGRTHDKIAAYLAALGIKRNGDAWESYISDPNRTDESGLLTYIYYPIRN
jgi:effector-binding domain-containing protein